MRLPFDPLDAAEQWGNVVAETCACDQRVSASRTVVPGILRCAAAGATQNRSMPEGCL